MAKSIVNFRLDDDVKNKMEKACSEMGISISVAFSMFAKKVAREQRIPFDVVADPFYSEFNMNRLRKAIADVEAGKSKLTEHELIEVDDD